MGRTTEYEHFGKRVKREGGDVYAGGLFGPRKVGTWEKTTALPESMQVESPTIDEDLSHAGLLSRYQDELGLPSKYIKKELRGYDLFKKGLCPFCEAQMEHTCCTRFNKRASSIATDYLNYCCAKCGSWVFDQRETQVAEPSQVVSDLDEVPMAASELPEVEYKIQLNPCGCLFDMDEDLWFPQAFVPENDRHRIKRLSEVKDEHECDRCGNYTEIYGLPREVESCEYCGEPFGDIKELTCNGDCIVTVRLTEEEMTSDEIVEMMRKHAQQCDRSTGYDKETLKIRRA